MQVSLIIYLIWKLSKTSTMISYVFKIEDVLLFSNKIRAVEVKNRIYDYLDVGLIIQCLDNELTIIRSKYGSYPKNTE